MTLETCPDVAGHDLGEASVRPDETILEEAQRLIYGDRQSEYGPGHEEMARVAGIWTVILGTEVTAYQAALCMSGLKLARACARYKRDNLVDGAGYLGLAQRVVEGR